MASQDIKPDNILLDFDIGSSPKMVMDAKLADFGKFDQFIASVAQTGRSCHISQAKHARLVPKSILMKHHIQLEFPSFKVQKLCWA